MSVKTIVLVCATITTGLIAGLFFGYQVSIIPAFKSLSSEEYIAAMQAINVTIQQDVFFECAFLGSAIFLLAALILLRSKIGSLQYTLLILATILYLIGVLGITIGANVPLNDMLALFPLQSSAPQQVVSTRAAFENQWNAWHLIRTIASVCSLILLVLACLSSNTVNSNSPKGAR